LSDGQDLDVADDAGALELVSNPHFSEGEGVASDSDDIEHGVLETTSGSRSLSLRRKVMPFTNAKMANYYLVYCIVCLLLTGILLAVAIWECLAPRNEARFWRRELRPWEEATEAFVGAALCAETFAVIVGLGPRAILRDRWRLCDAFIASLTLLCGLFFVCRRVAHAVRGLQRLADDIDVPILAMRFALQPMRMVSTAAMVVRAHKRRKKAKPVTEDPEVFDPRQLDSLPRSLCTVLTPSLASELRELLPCYLRFTEWHLGYAPKAHGTSLRTFYRQQAGPNLLIVRDADGEIFGGFAPEPWQQRSGAYGTGEAFVFSVTGGHVSVDQSSPAAPAPREDRRIEPHTATLQKGEVIQWSDTKIFGLGHALVVHEDFLRGSSSSCEAFGCRSPLTQSGQDFIIKDFECWHIGTPHRGYIPDD
jgi:hypothetical protein